MARPKKLDLSGPPILDCTLSYAISDLMLAYSAASLADSTMVSKLRTLNELRSVGGAKTMVHQLTPNIFRQVLNNLSSGNTFGRRELARKGRNVGTGQTEGRSPAALALDEATLKQFIKYAKENHWMPHWMAIPAAPAKSSAPVGGDLRNFHIIPMERFGELLDIAASIHPRTRIATAMGLLWARRISDVADARWGDMDWETKTANLRNIKRNGRQITVHIDQRMEYELRLWEKWMTSEYGVPQPDWYMVPNRVAGRDLMKQGLFDWARALPPEKWPVYAGEPSPRQTILHDFKRVFAGYGLETLLREGGHTLRRSGARAYAREYGVLMAQRLLDHDSEKTTRKYIGMVDGEQLAADVMKNKDPLGLMEQIRQEAGNNVIPFGRKTA